MVATKLEQGWRESQPDDEAMRPNFAYDFDDNTNLEAYVDILTSLSDTVPDAATAREKRILVWDHIMNLVEQGVSTGSKMLDRMLLQGRDAVLTTENVYYVPLMGISVPSVAATFSGTTKT